MSYKRHKCRVLSYFVTFVTFTRHLLRLYDMSNVITLHLTCHITVINVAFCRVYLARLHDICDTYMSYQMSFNDMDDSSYTIGNKRRRQTSYPKYCDCCSVPVYLGDRPKKVQSS